jgi:hypothetical protein
VIAQPTLDVVAISKSLCRWAYGEYISTGFVVVARVWGDFGHDQTALIREWQVVKD